MIGLQNGVIPQLKRILYSYYDCIKAINGCIKNYKSGTRIDILANSKIHKIVEGISLLTNRTQIFISRYDTFTLPFSGKMITSDLLPSFPKHRKYRFSRYLEKMKWFYNNLQGILGEDWTDTVSAWSDGLGIEYNVITNVDSNDVGFQFQGKDPGLFWEESC